MSVNNFNRRNFLGLIGLASLPATQIAKEMNGIKKHGLLSSDKKNKNRMNIENHPHGVSIIGLYGPWANSLMADKIPSFSFRNLKWENLEEWKKAALEKAEERLCRPTYDRYVEPRLLKQYDYDGLHIEELEWQLPYGRPTRALLLKPKDAEEPLPGILALHDHGGWKYFGKRKITKTSDHQHPLIVEHQKKDYDGVAWANEIAKKGFVVLVHDTYAFASRRVMLSDVPELLRNGLSDENPEEIENVLNYNKWAAAQEETMSKSLFCAGLTWPGVFLTEDQIALDVLSRRKDVISEKIGCGGLSGGGLRTVFLAGFDNRIKCAVCVGAMTTWKDFLLNKSYTHTAMTFVPGLPRELDYPEILGLRVPLPTLALFDKDDGLFTLSEMEAANEILKEIFNKANASEKYRGSFYPGPHKFDRAMQQEAFDWFEKWLK